MKKNYFQETVTYGGESMTRGEMISHLQKLSVASGHPNPQRLVDRYLQGFELGLVISSNRKKGKP